MVVKEEELEGLPGVGELSCHSRRDLKSSNDQEPTDTTNASDQDVAGEEGDQRAQLHHARKKQKKRKEKKKKKKKKKKKSKKKKDDVVISISIWVSQAQKGARYHPTRLGCVRKEIRPTNKVLFQPSDECSTQ